MPKVRAPAHFRAKRNRKIRQLEVEEEIQISEPDEVFYCRSRQTEEPEEELLLPVRRFVFMQLAILFNQEECTMKYQKEKLPDNAKFSGATPPMTEKTVLKGILSRHMAPRGKYARLIVTRGNLQFVWEDTGETFDADERNPVVIFPERFHHVVITGPVEFHVEFYSVPQCCAVFTEAERPGEKFVRNP